MASAALPDGLSPRRATNGCEISGLEGRRVLRDDVVMSATVIDKNHGLTLPESICSALGLQPNDQVEWRVEDGEIRGRKLPLPALADAKTQFQELAEKWRSETGGVQGSVLVVYTGSGTAILFSKSSGLPFGPVIQRYSAMVRGRKCKRQGLTLARASVWAGDSTLFGNGEGAKV